MGFFIWYEQFYFSAKQFLGEILSLYIEESQKKTGEPLS